MGKGGIIMIIQIKSRLISNLILNELEPKNVQELMWTGLQVSQEYNIHVQCPSMQPSCSKLKHHNNDY